MNGKKSDQWQSLTVFVQERKELVKRTYLLAPLLCILKQSPSVPTAATDGGEEEESQHLYKVMGHTGGYVHTNQSPAAQLEGEKAEASSAPRGATRVSKKAA